MEEPRLREIVASMQDIYQKTGIHPPFSLEVRIHDYADIDIGPPDKVY